MTQKETTILKKLNDLIDTIQEMGEVLATIGELLIAMNRDEDCEWDYRPNADVKGIQDNIIRRKNDACIRKHEGR